MTACDPLRTQGPRHVAAADPAMAALIPRIGRCALPKRRSPYAALVRSIVTQQLSMAAASTIHRRMQTTLGGPISLRRIQSTSDDALLAAGLSRRKLRFIRELTCRVATGEVDFPRAQRPTRRSRRPEALCIARCRPLDGRHVSDVRSQPPRRPSAGGQWPAARVSVVVPPTAVSGASLDGGAC